MAKGNIDPAFQAAPYLGDSSHDPIEFTRRQATIKYQRSKEKQAETERNIAKGLDKLMIDLEGWNDQAGFKEVISRQQKAKDMYIGLATKGVNFVNPTTEGEVMAYKALTDYQAKTKEIADLRNSQKVKMDVINKLRMTEQVKGKDDQTVDWDATEANLMKALNDNTIAGRDNILNNALVIKPQIGDSYKYVEERKNALPKLDQVQTPYTDPTTGQQGTRLEVQWTPEKVKETEKVLRELYRAAPEKIKNAVEMYKDRTPELKLASLEDAFVAQHMPQYQEKLIKKVSGSGGGINFNFLGAQTKITPGEHQTNDMIYGDRNYNDRYDITSSKPHIIPIHEGESFSGAKRITGEVETGGWQPIPEGGGAIEGALLFYDPNSDKLIFRASQDARYPWIKNNTTVAIPRKNLAKADDLPIKLPSGKIGTLKEIMPVQSVTKKFPVNWSKPTTPYIPSNKKKVNEELRPDGTKKGTGFLGTLKRPDGDVSTELSIGVNIGGKETEIPTLVPTLSKDEINYLLSTPPDKILTANSSMFKKIQQKAVDHAKKRIKEGKTPFADNSESPKRQ